MNSAVKNISSAETIADATGGPRLLIAAGGTGGHVYPAIAIADALKQQDPGSEILFVGTRDRMEWQAVPKAGYEIRSIWISGFHRRLTPQNLLFPVKLLVSLVQSLMILKQFRPDVVISCGGFAAGPVSWMASKLGIPLVIQEQNSYPGVTNRMLSRHADAIFIAFDEAADFLDESAEISVSGNPVRSNLTEGNRQEALSIFGLEATSPVLLILGGSGGAVSLNQAMEENIDRLHDQAGIQIIWQCGPRYFDEITSRIDTDSYPALRLMPYIDQMAAAYAAADLVVSRAGASSCSELMLTGKPAILVPSPHVAGDHQTRNAKAMQEQGAALLLEDRKVSEDLPGIVESILADPERVEEMSRASLRLAKPDAANEIAKKILDLRNGNHE
ncbi:MAG: undecaprenyldiphospho-muramoylpentapeptide beta-N-acetylglucosaminyltransferase [Balneolaceae bacterium]